jgi:8-oxo-dGTP pyrophosphatase MutT (NUDIX family)
MENQDKIYVDWIDKVKILQKAAVRNKGGAILALKRTGDQNRPRPNCWDLAGGRVEPSDIEKWKEKSGRGDDNDILVNALRREIKEETNLDVSNIRIIHSASGYSEKKGVFIVAIGYACEAVNESELKLSCEHCDSCWVPKDEFLNLEIGDDGGLIGRILRKI